MSTVIRPKQDFPTNAEPDGKGILDYLRPFTSNTIGGKFAVAVTGLLLTGFVIAHLIGNLKIYAGQASINHYAELLKSLGPLLWIARIGLLALFVVHIGLVLKLKARSKAARPIGYAHPRTVQATAASRFMLSSGLVILAFLIFHLAHFTLGGFSTVIDGKTVNYLDLKDSEGHHDVYSMVVYGFQNVPVSIAYIIAQILLFFHLIHGVQSAFQTLGANTPRLQRVIRGLGLAIALFLLVGNISIPVAILSGNMQPNPDISLTLGGL